MHYLMEYFFLLLFTGFCVPPLGCELTREREYLLRRSWLHLRQYHQLLDLYRSVEWSASDWNTGKVS